MFALLSQASSCSSTISSSGATSIKRLRYRLVLIYRILPLESEMRAGGINPGLAPSGLPWGYNPSHHTYHNHHRSHNRHPRYHPSHHPKHDNSAQQQALLQRDIQAAQNAAQTQPPSRYYEATHNLFPDQPSARLEGDTFRAEAPEGLVDGPDDDSVEGDDRKKGVRRSPKKGHGRLKSWAKGLLKSRAA